ncbi:glutathione S-transferase family protein [Pigmentiphaga aceris]|uniref:Glutathione S-transferase family protein n=1 Tax=Pigmentiphaga aceris TaxID=1940612 RepID=A0A5C0AZG8_9BURK|nr:glutathione S-transferase family protein [Pigmentiphaga aceris]QEI07839.1 glutathione S-transferase family protein [Pigmentiphaga aceris]
MLTVFHSPQSRSTSVIALLNALDAIDQVKIEIVTITRQDGTGARDPRNPHPDGKVPLLMDGEAAIWERSAIFQYLADRFPQAGLNVPVGHPLRGTYLSWLAWYGGVMEPVMVLEAAELQHPFITGTFRSSTEMKARLAQALTEQPFLVGERPTAADLLLHSPFAWFGKPGVPAIDAWVDRCMALPGAAYAKAFDEEHALA